MADKEEVNTVKPVSKRELAIIMRRRRNPVREARRQADLTRKRFRIPAYKARTVPSDYMM